MRDPRLINQIVLFLWMPVFLLWAVSQGATKQTTHSRSAGLSHMAVWLVWISWFVLFSHGLGRRPLMDRFITTTPATVYAGLAVTVVGLGFAVWARFSIGRNWSALIDMKAGHQLIRHGPYGIVRHPIYAGFMLATLGTAIAFGEWSGLVAVLLIVTGWGYKARLEEKALREHFGAQYDLYSEQVNALIPFIY